KRALRDDYKEALKEWGELKVRWLRAVGPKPFPVAKPQTGRVRKLYRVSSNSRRRQKDREKCDRKLDVWDVCLIQDCDGERTAVVIRHDKVFSRRRKLYTEYVEAAIEVARARKENPDVELNKDDLPKRPVVSVLKGGLRSVGLAEKYAEKYNQKLDKMREKQETEAGK
ncbi:unnamed protein product, partial [marine sediment metagenome]